LLPLTPARHGDQPQDRIFGARDALAENLDLCGNFALYSFNALDGTDARLHFAFNACGRLSWDFSLPFPRPRCIDEASETFSACSEILADGGKLRDGVPVRFLKPLQVLSHFRQFAFDIASAVGHLCSPQMNCRHIYTIYKYLCQIGTRSQPRAYSLAKLQSKIVQLVFDHLLLLRSPN